MKSLLLALILLICVNRVEANIYLLPPLQGELLEFDDDGVFLRSLGAPVPGGNVNSAGAHLSFGPDGDLYGIVKGYDLWRYEFANARFVPVFDIEPHSKFGAGGMTVGQDGRIYVQLTGAEGEILVLSRDGEILDHRFPELGHVSSFESMLGFGPDGRLYGYNDRKVWAHVTTGESFVPVFNLALFTSTAPAGMTIGKDGGIYVQYAGSSAAVQVFDPADNDSTHGLGSYGGGVGSHNAQLAFGPDGRLYGVGKTEIWRYDFELESFNGIIDYTKWSQYILGGFAVGPPRRPVGAPLSPWIAALPLLVFGWRGWRRANARQGRDRT